MSKRMKNTKHYLSKRIAQLGQTVGQNLGTRKESGLPIDYSLLEDVTKKMQVNYKDVIEKTEKYFRPETTARIRRAVMDSVNVANLKEVEESRLGRLGNAMVKTGNDFRAQTTLGSSFLLAGEMELEIARSFLIFENTAEKKFVDPLDEFLKDNLDQLLSKIKKVQSDRLYLAAQKHKEDKVVRDMKNYDPSIIKHAQEKTAALEQKLEAELSVAEEQMRRLLYELEDTQLEVLVDLLKAQAQFFLHGYETICGVLTNIADKTSRPIESILGNTRTQGSGLTKARALYDYTAANEDEISFSAGDIIMITNTDTGEEGWVEGVINGYSGLLPSQYIEPLSADSLAQQTTNIGGTSQPGPAPLPEEVETPSYGGGDDDTYESIDAVRANMRNKSPGPAPPARVSIPTVEVVAPEVQQAALLQGQLDRSHEAALRRMNAALDDLLQASVQSQSPQFAVNSDGFEQCNDQVISAAQEMVGVAKALVVAGKGTPEQLVKAMDAAVDAIAKLTGDVKWDAHCIPEASDRAALFLSAKGLLQALMALVDASHRASGKDAATADATLKPHQKAMIGAISNVLDSLTKIADNVRKPKEVDPMEAELAEVARAIALAEQQLSGIRQNAEATGIHLPDVHEALVSDAQRLAQSASLLMRAASEAQQSIKAAGGNVVSGEGAYYKDGTWAQGLISAAKAVAAGMSDVVSAANNTVTHGADPISAVAAAKAIAAATAQLVYSSATKNPDRRTQDQLASAGRNVTAATDALVSSVDRRRNADAESAGYPERDLSLAERRARELEAQTHVLKMERELESARTNLADVRKAKYAGAGSAATSNQAPPPAAAQPSNTSAPALPPPQVQRSPSPVPPPAAEDDELMARLRRLRE
eukprot:Opistho-2@68234